MAWGARGGGGGVEDLVRRLVANDPSLRSLTLLPQRRLDTQAAVASLCGALAANTTLTELTVASHPLGPEAAAAFAGALAAPGSRLATVSIGNSAFGDEAMTELCRGLQASASLTHLDAERKASAHPERHEVQKRHRACRSRRQPERAW
jgi:hypothetical protein